MSVNIAVSYNVFDNEELLEDSILNIRDHVEKITVVYQKISNFGNKCDPQLEDFLYSLREMKLIDQLVLFKTNLSNDPETNERKKNNLGYFLSLKNGADYHMGMACDEFYFKEDILNLKDMLSQYPVDLVTSYMYTYYKTSNYRFAEVEDYVVPILNKVVDDGRQNLLGGPMPLLIDPTRRMKYDSCFCFPKTKPLMHHLSHVRKDFRKKLINSTANKNWYDKIDAMCEHYDNWTPGQDAFLHGEYIKLEKTDIFKKEIIF